MVPAVARLMIKRRETVVSQRTRCMTTVESFSGWVGELKVWRQLDRVPMPPSVVERLLSETESLEKLQVTPLNICKRWADHDLNDCNLYNVK